jgi:hypothetical protein
MRSPGSRPGPDDKDREIDDLVSRATELAARLDVTVAGMERRLRQGRQGT